MIGSYGATCGLTAANTAYCWGNNIMGQLGNTANSGVSTPNNAPLAVQGGLRFVSLYSYASSGDNQVCGLTASGAAYCWGSNAFGQLGNNTNLGTYSDVPLPVQGGHTFKNLGVGAAHVCGVTVGGSTYCWGMNFYGQLGNTTNVGTVTANTTPLLVQGGRSFAYLANGQYSSCGLENDGSAYCWGHNQCGQLGNTTNVGTGTPNVTPLAVQGARTYKHISQGSTHVCAITLSDGAAYCWGYNTDGQLGNATNLATGTPTMPVLVGGRQSYAEIGTGQYHSCGLTSGGKIYCWGDNQHGQLGNPTNVGTGANNITPLLVQGGYSWMH